MNGLKICVPVKQVPESGDVQMDPESGTMMRSGAPAVLNPLDLYAIECALQLRTLHGGHITAITMGPPPAERALREAIALGCDDAVLLSDRQFGGADTWATSRTLAEGIRHLGPRDLVITGERATDGDTSQVGPGIAAWLDIPLATYVARINSVLDSTITVERLMEDRYQILTLTLPALITVVKEIAAPGLPTLAGKRRSRTAEIPVLDRTALNLDATEVGLRGSPTRVVSITTPRVTRAGTVVQASDDAGVEHAVDGLITYLAENGLLPPVGER